LLDVQVRLELAVELLAGAVPEGDESFNEWARRLAVAQREKGQAVVYVQVKG